MTRIVGILPMAGSGSRLGLPFPKPLAPTITREGIVPLYRHAFDRLRQVTREVVLVVPPNPDPCLGDLPGTWVRKPLRGELPSSLAVVAKNYPPDTLCAVALPDSVWFPLAGFQRLVTRYLTEPSPIDGVLGLFVGPTDVLDGVRVDANGIVSSVEVHGSLPWQFAIAESHGKHDGKRDAPVPNTQYIQRVTTTARAREEHVGWGCFVATAGSLRGLTDDRPLGPQLAEYRFAAVALDGPYLDLGTPDRYIAHHDLRPAG